MSAARNKRRRLAKAAKVSTPSAPIYLDLYEPKIEHIPVGASLRPGAMILEIMTPPVFGEAKNERRLFRYPVYLPEPLRAPTPENALIAFQYLQDQHEVVRASVKQLAALSRTPAARAWARKNHHKVYPIDRAIENLRAL